MFGKAKKVWSKWWRAAFAVTAIVAAIGGGFGVSELAQPAPDTVVVEAQAPKGAPTTVAKVKVFLANVFGLDRG